MLKEFRFSNFGSFRDETVLSMEAVGLKELKEAPRKDGSDTLLPLAAIYGKNGGGKTNVLCAFWYAVRFVCNAQQTQHENAPIPVVPFLLDDTSKQAPTSFNFEYRMDGVRYWYGFSATKEKICSESLSHAPKGQKALVFSREGQNFTFRNNADKKKRELIRELVAENQLFLAVASGTNDADCKRAMSWFRQYLFNGNDYNDFFDQVYKNADNPAIIKAMSDYANAADVGIDHIEVKQDTEFERWKENWKENVSMGIFPSDFPDNVRSSLKRVLEINPDVEETPQRLQIKSLHKVTGEDGKSRLFDLPSHFESDGTRNLMGLVPVLERVLDCGGVLIMDELENGMHPLLVKMILSRFQSPRTNPKNAQLIFTTHSAELLDMSILRKDQIYLADKDRETGVSSLYSVSDFSTPTHENVRKAYLAGKYGASPDIQIEEVAP
ncbi:MAG: AAA family ATPase [Oscillibacter sp.]|nr:AAA family ATPase [Oscillibacter sp.]